LRGNGNRLCWLALNQDDWINFHMMREGVNMEVFILAVKPGWNNLFSSNIL